VKKVFISTTTFGEDDPAVFKALKAAGWSWTLNPYRRKLSDAEIGELLARGEYQGLLAGLETLDKGILSAARGLKVISRVGVGLDNVDQVAAKGLGIKVFNTPGILTDAVAELTLGLMLGVLRKIALLDRRMRVGHWEKKMGALLKGRVVGIVGFGQIGQRVAALVTAFGAKVVFADIAKISRKGMAQVTLKRLMASADIISLHASGKEAVLDAAAFRTMKQGVIIINTARGALIDEAALDQGLLDGRVAGAGLDVFVEEPYTGALLSRENVILTAHVGSYAKEARIAMEKMAVANLVRGFRGQR
jgi:D-3-phosphoglycerate dehydrogenase